MSQSTPTPWVLEPGRAEEWNIHSGEPWTHPSMWIASLMGRNGHVGFTSYEACEANARLIIRAVNSHAALVAALELIMPLAKGYRPSGQTSIARVVCDGWITNAEAALALAREDTP